MNDVQQPIPQGPTPMQEAIERDVRVTIGDLHVQLIVARNRIAELEAQVSFLTQQLEPKTGEAETNKPNGKRGEVRPPAQ